MISKKYILLLFLLLFTFLGITYFYQWKHVLKYNKIGLDLSTNFYYINYNEIDSYLNDSKDVIIYIYNNSRNKEISNFENNFINLLDDKNIFLKKILYTNFTKVDLQNFNIKFDCNLDSLPVLVSFKNMEVYSIFSVKDNNYDINSLDLYLKSVLFYD